MNLIQLAVMQTRLFRVVSTRDLCLVFQSRFIKNTTQERLLIDFYSDSS